MAKKKVSSSFSNRIIYTVIVLIIITCGSFYIRERFFKPGFKHYSEFGIDIPTNYKIHGIDVSKYQDDINWDLVKKMKVKNIAIEFAFIKATEGATLVDDRFKQNMEDCKEVGIKRGAYHFFIPSRTGKAQAANFIENVHLTKGDLPPVLDIEQLNGTPVNIMQDRIAEWLDIVEKKYKVKPIIYCNIDFFENYIKDRFSDYPLWIAHYLVKDKPRINKHWDFWQHNETGQVTGIRRPVDFNVFSSGRWAFNNMLIQE
jgi:lysozyme